jgi:hypothetical protein
MMYTRDGSCAPWVTECFSQVAESRLFINSASSIRCELSLQIRISQRWQ